MVSLTIQTRVSSIRLLFGLASILLAACGGSEDADQPGANADAGVTTESGTEAAPDPDAAINAADVEASSQEPTCVRGTFHEGWCVVWEETTGMSERSNTGTLTPMENGHALLVGGHSLANQQHLRDVQHFDPNTLTWDDRATLPEGLSQHRAAAVQGNRTIVVGGLDGNSSDAIIYDATDDAWSSLGLAPVEFSPGTYGQDMRAIDETHVIATDGWRWGVFDAAQGQWASGYFPHPFNNGKLVPLSDGRAMLLNCQDSFADENNLTVAIYSVTAGTWSYPSNKLPSNLTGECTGVELSPGQVLVVGSTRTEKDVRVYEVNVETLEATPRASVPDDKVDWQDWRTLYRLDDQLVLGIPDFYSGFEGLPLYHVQADRWTDMPAPFSSSDYAVVPLPNGGWLMTDGYGAWVLMLEQPTFQ